MSAIRSAASSFASWPPDVSALRRNIVYNVVGQILVIATFHQLGRIGVFFCLEAATG